MTRLGRYLLTCLPALLCAGIYLAPLVGRLTTHVLGPFGGTDAVMQAAILEWTGRHFWQPETWLQMPIFFPAPNALTFMDSLLGQALLVWPLRMLGAGPAMLYNMAQAASLVLAAGLFIWLWSAGRRPGLAGGVGALALIGSPYVGSQIGHLNQLPPPGALLVLVLLLLAGDPGRDPARARPLLTWGWAAALVLQSAWGWYGLAFALLISAFFFASWIWRAWRGQALRGLIGRWAVPALVAAAAIGLLISPYLQSRRIYPEYERSSSEVRAFSADLKHILNAGAYRRSWQDWRGEPLQDLERFAGRPRQVLHPGWMAAMLALYGLIRRRRLSAMQRRRGWCLLALGGIGLLLAFGDSVAWPGSTERLRLPMGWLQDVLAPLRALRAVNRFYFLSAVAVAWWAAAGWQALRTRSGPGGVIVAGACAVFLVIESIPVAVPAVALGSGNPVGCAPADPLKGLPAGAVLTLPAPADESAEDITEARWAHRMLAHDHPVTGGVSGWVPPASRDLRARLSACQLGQEDPLPLLAELRARGVRYVEVAEQKGHETGSFWQRSLQRAGYRPQPSVPGYTLYLPPSDAAPH